MSNPAAIQSNLEAAQQAATRGEYVRSEQLLHEVLTEDPSCLMALDLLGFVQFFQGRPNDAEQACRRALAVDPDRAYSNKGLGLCLAKQGRVDEGLPYLHKAIALEPNWFDPRWDMAVVLTEVGRFEEALEVLAEAERVIPSERSRFTQLRQHIRVRSGPK